MMDTLNYLKCAYNVTKLVLHVLEETSISVPVVWMDS